MSVSIYKKLIAYKAKREFTATVHLPISKIESDSGHPRKIYMRSALEELAASIKEHGIIVPLIVRRSDDKSRYTVISGERRLKAAAMAGMAKVPAVVVSMDSAEALAFSVMENVQREGLYFLNEADAYHSYIYEHGGDIDRLAALVGRSPQYVVNKIKMLGLSERTREIIFYNRLTEKHAHLLLKIDDAEMQAEAAQMMAECGLNARKAEAAVHEFLSGAAADESADESVFSEEKCGHETISAQTHDEGLFRGCVRDTRIIENTIRKTADIIRQQRVGTTLTRTENDEFIDFTIKIKKSCIKPFG